MKVSSILYNSFIEIVKDKITFSSSKTSSVHNKAINNGRLAESKIIKDQLSNNIKKIFKKLKHNNCYSLNITFHEKTKTYVIKIIDNETKQVVREAPLEKILDMLSFIEDLTKTKQVCRRK